MKQLIQKAYAQTSSQLNSIYKKRKQALLFQKLMWLLTGLFFVFMLINIGVSYFPNSTNSVITFFKQFQSSVNHPYANTYPILILMGVVYFSSYFFTIKFSSLKTQEYKTISKMVTLLFPQVEFTQNAKAPTSEILKSKLFYWLEKDAPMYSYGQIRATVNNASVNIADIGIIEQNISNRITDTIMRIPGINMIAVLYQYVLKNILTNKSADNVYYTFRGMFCWMNFKKNLLGHTVILTNNQSEKINRFFSGYFKEEQRIQLEDPRFTNQFVVYSTDQIEARYVLSLAFMEKIVTLKEKFNQPILLSFQNKQLYLVVKNKHGLFSFPVGKLDDIKIIEELVNDINTALQITTNWG